MITENVGVKYGYNVTDLNKTGSNSYLNNRLTREAENVKLEDGQVVLSSERTDGQNAQGSGGSLGYSAGSAAGTGKSARFASELSVMAGETTEYVPAESGKADAAREATEELMRKVLNIKDPVDAVNPEIAEAGGEKKTEKEKKHDSFAEDSPLCECETCRNRRYQDASDDSAVSFQQPTQMSPEKAAHMVKSHEMEHVRREQHKADEEDKKVVSQSVQIKTAFCPECGKLYVAGGVTRTRSVSDKSDLRNLLAGGETEGESGVGAVAGANTGG